MFDHLTVHCLEGLLTWREKEVFLPSKSWHFMASHYSTSNIVTCSFVVTVKKYNSSLHQRKKKRRENIEISVYNTLSFILDIFHQTYFHIFREKKKKKSFVMEITHFKSNNNQLIFMTGIQ